jgi:hypothetical protein
MPSGGGLKAEVVRDFLGIALFDGDLRAASGLVVDWISPMQ